MVRDAVVAGAGAALRPRSLVADDVAQGRLISWGNTPKEIWVLCSSRRLLSSKIAAFVAYLDEVFRKFPLKNLPRCD
jgi:DNA-binding transcriptional LysR family regulator